MISKKIKTSQIVHDLKVPLAVIESGVEGMLHRKDIYGTVTEKQETVLSRLLRNVSVMKSLVNDLLEVERSEEGKFRETPLQLGRLLQEAFVESFDFFDSKVSEKLQLSCGLAEIKKSLQEENVGLLLEERDWTREFLLDEIMIKQILRNLLNNSLRYRQKKIEVQAWKDKDRLFLAVEDDGEGISVEYHEKIFESYFQVDPSECNAGRGHGLGLAGVKVLVENLGGTLFLESEVGRGTRITVSLPAETNP